MLNPGRPSDGPLLTQQPPKEESGQDVSRHRNQKIELIRKKLQMGALREEPTMENQEALFPDSVVTVGTRFFVLNPESEEDMQRYSSLCQSTHKRGAQVIIAEEVKWSEASSAWKILCKVRTRMFRSLTAAQEAEILRQTDEPDDAELDTESEESLGS